MQQIELSGSEIAEKLIANQHQIDRLLLEQSLLMVALAQTDYWDEQGSVTAYDWIRANCHLTTNAVSDRVRVGERMALMPGTVKAMNAGEIGFAHVAVMARTAEAVGDRFDESQLLEKARETTPGKFHYKCLQYRHAADPAAYAKDQYRIYEERHLTLSRWEDGSLILMGVLDPVGGMTLRSALEPLARKSGTHDDRNREQRLADALVELATKGTRVQMQVTSSVDTLLGLVGAPGAENEFSLPISSKSVERWACDCSISRVLLQDSVVIDVGRSVRTTSGPRRRALIARDQHCRWPGCERPASWCAGHHLKHWIDGGGSEIENQVLLCGRHHWLVHEGNWQLVKTDDGFMPIAPMISFGKPRAPD